jgi:hypothetical protein
MPGKGKAWFDGLEVKLDGHNYDTKTIDLNFEGKTIRGFASRYGCRK